MVDVVNIALLSLLIITGVAVVRQTNLFGAVILTGIYSLLSAGLFVNMDAMDVAFTEAAVGVGVATVLMLAAMTLAGQDEAPARRGRALPLGIVLVVGAILVYGMIDVPPFGEPGNPIHQHVAPRYTESVYEETHMPNAVTALLASYRGYDTMGETTVIFTAGVSVLLLLAGRKRRRAEDEAAGREDAA